MRIPKCVPRNLNRIPLNLSQRVGLRHISRIGKAPLHPTYVCDYNSCEDLGDWTFGTDVTTSIDGSIYPENAGSLKVVTAVAGARALATLNFAQCNAYWGFYVRLAINDAADIYIGFRDGSGNNHLCRAYRTGGTREIRGEYDDGTINHTSPYSSFTANTWYWIECYHAAGVGHAMEKDGGAVFGGDSGVVGFTMTQFYLYLIGGASGLGTVWIDYIRNADRWEYPPK